MSECTNKINGELKLSPKMETFCFCWDGKILFEIRPDGFKFNLKDFPDFKPDDFARKFIEILESNYKITFKKD